MIAPQIIFIERLQILIDGNHARSRRIDRQRRDLIAGNFRVRNRFARRIRERLHVIVVALRGEIGIVFAPMQWIFRHAGTQPPALRIHNRDAHTQCSEIDARNNGQSVSE